jgi:hypothetical protein
MTVLIVIFAVLAVGLALVIYGTLVKNKWGVNLDSVSALVAIPCLLNYANQGRVSNPCGVVGHVRVADLTWTSGDAN